MKQELKQNEIVILFHNLEKSFEEFKLTLNTFNGFSISNNKEGKNLVFHYFDTIQEINAFHQGLVAAKKMKGLK